MKRLVALALIAALPALAKAAPVSCADIQNAQAEGRLVAKDFTTYSLKLETLQIKLLRKALVLSHTLTKREAGKAKAAQLVEDYEPIFKNLVINDTEFQAVDVALGDNPYVYLFTVDTGDFAGISSQDGSIYVDGVYCDTESDLF